MEDYKKAMLEIIYFDTMDIITASSGDETSGSDDPEEGEPVNP